MINLINMTHAQKMIAIANIYMYVFEEAFKDFGREIKKHYMDNSLVISDLNISRIQAHLNLYLANNKLDKYLYVRRRGAYYSLELSVRPEIMRNEEINKLILIYKMKDLI